MSAEEALGRSVAADCRFEAYCNVVRDRLEDELGERVATASQAGERVICLGHLIDHYLSRFRQLENSTDGFYLYTPKVEYLVENLLRVDKLKRLGYKLDFDKKNQSIWAVMLSWDAVDA